MTMPLISSQRFLDPHKVLRKASQFKVFVVRTMEVSLRGRPYRVLLDGHHNLAAAALAGVSPTWRGPSRKMLRVQASMLPTEFERMLINNLTDSDWYYVDTGEVVPELIAAERAAA
ncbi:hypothetical protein [Corticimicrobacter populi]|uniref:Chromosome partitioning protein ParB n=1 Tax=Corticimicrobacter populi TaxID=2175229 RepID=A0A2V1K372_9BURK|nr:hypothetical protein [Corticimicrobacter populi]PWF25040.1 hypothetical protein DD235_02400 [Corticimicrobacter populi]